MVNYKWRPTFIQTPIFFVRIKIRFIVSDIIIWIETEFKHSNDIIASELLRFRILISQIS